MQCKIFKYNFLLLCKYVLPTLDGPPPELVNRTPRRAMTTTSLCSKSNKVLLKDTSQILMTA